MQIEILILIGLTLLPFLELRASIPYGIFQTDIHWLIVFLICVITNILLAPVIYFLLNKLVNVFLIIKPFARVYNYYVLKTQKKIHAFVERWGELGVALFIAVPLPGSGVYSGALGSYIIGLSKKKFFYAAILGVTLAGVAVTAICLSSNSIFYFLINNLK